MSVIKLTLQKLSFQVLYYTKIEFSEMTQLKFLVILPVFLFFSFALSQDLSASDDDNCCNGARFKSTSKCLSMSLNALSSTLGVIADWQEKEGVSSSGLKIANAVTSGAAGVLKLVNARFYDNYTYGKEGCHGKRVAHITLSGLVITFNVASLILSSLSVYSTSPNEIHAYNLASSLTNCGGMFFKSLDLWISPQPDAFKENYTRVPAGNRQEAQGSSVEFGRVFPERI